jgi:ribosomal protein S18 acetylase RimI-like enzyme
VYLCTGERDELTGFIVFFPADQHLPLENVAVSNAGRGKGIGKALIRLLWNKQWRRVSTAFISTQM